MFETMGWLCCHALKVLFFDLNFSCIPEKYILKDGLKMPSMSVDLGSTQKKKRR